MGWNETAITVTGTVVSEVTHKRLASGFSRAAFRVLSVERRYNSDLGEYVDGDKLFLNVTCWRQLADGVGRALVKGDPVVVTGKLRNRDYDLDGERRNISEIEATAVGPNLRWAKVEIEHVGPAAAEVPVPGIVAPRKEDERAREVVDVPF
ncbi:single-stranded DNA-binding protein [Umezawaea tangerina]|uniref:Single-stranded DNA-binding protein n=1 Tax=Umezawaea tangerina TaxID=84725 RepID=A0A2T0SSE3_9PSEU|nr:single-stranded DNA-binding protein [Umezawaea tangerina]PRY36318.1 single-stranded DNA-binding protein [Umezawaea tangerina]